VVERLLLDEIVEDLSRNGTESRSAPRRDKRRIRDSRKTSKNGDECRNRAEHHHSVGCYRRFGVSLRG
jgi:hypothetical protein